MPQGTLVGTLEPVSNRATWTETYQLIDTDTGDGINITGALAATIVIRDIDSKTTRLQGSLSDGTITLSDPTNGQLTWTFSKSSMSTLREGNYEIGLAIQTSDGTDVQLIIAHLPVMDGIVT